MFRISVLSLMLVFFVGLTVCVFAQVDKTRELVAALDKTKYKKKEKKGFTVEVYVDIKNEPVVKKNPSEYSGVYTDPDGFTRLDLRVSADGSAEGTGYEGENASHGQRYTLKNARVIGALLTATKVIENGDSRKFEAVFVNRTTNVGTNPTTDVTTVNSYGLGYIEYGSGWSNRVFLELMK